MATFHVSEQPFLAALKGGLMFGDTQNILADGDLDSTAAAAKADVDADVANLHVSQRHFGNMVKASLDHIDDYDSTYLTGGDVDKATMLALSTATAGRTLR